MNRTQGSQTARESRVWRKETEARGAAVNTEKEAMEKAAKAAAEEGKNSGQEEDQEGAAAEEGEAAAAAKEDWA